MFDPSINAIFFLTILLIFVSTSVIGDCSNARECSNPHSGLVWCCPYSDTCGNNYKDCEEGDKPGLSPAIIAILILIFIFVFIICLICCLRSQLQQRVRTIYLNSNGEVVRNPGQQQIPQRNVPVVDVRPVYNTEAAPSVPLYPSLYEAPPPSYESLITTLPTIHRSTPSPPMTATAQCQI